MKKLGILILFSISIYGMHKEIKDAITNGDEHELKKLLRTPTQDTPLLTANLDALEQYASELATAKEKNAHTLNNRHVYQRSLVAACSIAGGAYAVVDYFKTGNFDQEKLAQIIGGAIALYHGGNNLFLGLTNRDAHNESARHHAILMHLNKAKNTKEDSV